MMRYLAPVNNNGPAVTSSSSSSSNISDCSPILHSNEYVAWTVSTYKGIWHKKCIRTYVLTNERFIIWNNIGGYVAEEIALENITDVVIVNQHRQNNSSYQMFSSGGRGSRYMTGNSKAVSQLVGDLVILHDSNIPFTTLTNVNDPVGLAKLIHSLIKQRLSSFER